MLFPLIVRMVPCEIVTADVAPNAEELPAINEPPLTTVGPV